MADEYRVRVRLEAGPFEVDQETPSVIRAKDLRRQSSFLNRLTDLLRARQSGGSDDKQEKEE